MEELKKGFHCIAFEPGDDIVMDLYVDPDREVFPRVYTLKWNQSKLDPFFHPLHMHSLLELSGGVAVDCATGLQLQ